jgi:hypothetical protein
MRNNVYRNHPAFVASRDAAILEALVIDRAAIMFQADWHTPARLLFEEMERFDDSLQAAGSAAANDEASPATPIGGLT